MLKDRLKGLQGLRGDVEGELGVGGTDEAGIYFDGVVEGILHVLRG